MNITDTIFHGDEGTLGEYYSKNEGRFGVIVRDSINGPGWTPEELETIAADMRIRRGEPAKRTPVYCPSCESATAIAALQGRSRPKRVKED